MAAQARAVCAARRNLQLLQDPQARQHSHAHRRLVQGLVCHQTSVQLALCMLVQVPGLVLEQAHVLRRVQGSQAAVWSRVS